MRNIVGVLQPWVTFAGCVLVVAVLYWAQPLLVPIAIALLLSFLLAPPVDKLERWIGRTAAVLMVVILVFSALGAVGWVFAREMTGLAGELPTYRQNIRQKIGDVRSLGKGGALEQVQNTVEDIQSEMSKGAAPRGTVTQPVIVQSQQTASVWGFPPLVAGLVQPLSTVGLVAVLVIFMLLERQDLRNRVIGLVGHGHLAATTKAFDEAASRVSRYLLMQSLVNVTYGVLAGTGLHFLGVPYAFSWAALGASLRFIPYIGPWVGAGGPILVSLAAFPGWTTSLWVLGFCVGLELFTNFVLESILYAGAAGVSQVALLVAVAFWTWLWGPLGLLMATPLTVCLVVIGKHVPGFDFLATLMADTPPLAPDVAYYQRLLARDPSEASDLIEQHLKEQPPDTVYDALMLPALNYAERDRIDRRLSPEEEAGVVDATRELMTDLPAPETTTPALPEEDEADERSATRVTVLGYPANSVADEVSLRMLGALLHDTGVSLDVVSGRMMVSEIIAMVRDRAYGLVCIADLPPSAPSKTRYLVKKLRQAQPNLGIVVGRWAPPSLRDEGSEPLLDTGATAVGATLIETRDQLCRLADHLPQPAALATTKAG